MIPKIIHYCWFGKKNKNKSIKKYINSWKRKLPDYKFIEWNEENFDVNKYQYTKEAYKMKKYAFVSDVARIEALYNYGGIYLDTDIEIYKDFSELLNKYDAILGYENEGRQLMTAFLASKPKEVFLLELLEQYKNKEFILENGKLDLYPNTYRLTENMKKKKLKCDNKKAILDNNIAIFPENFFSATRFSTNEDLSNEYTYTKHNFNASWKPMYVRIRHKLKIFLINIYRRWRKL